MQESGDGDVDCGEEEKEGVLRQMHTDLRGLPQGGENGGVAKKQE